MHSILETLRTAVTKHTAYRRTRDALANIPRDIAIDLGLFPEDADLMARAAVYGR